MKNLLKRLLLIFSIVLFIPSCNKDDNSGTPTSPPVALCQAEGIKLKETKVDNLASANSIQVSFDATNASGKDYDVAKGVPGSFIYTKIIVETTDGVKYETKAPFLITALSNGATASVIASGDYGAGKTYKSYTISLYCQ
jgi:hypothetical protein